MYYLVGNMFGFIKVQASIRVLTEMEAMAIKPLLEGFNILTNIKIYQYTDIPSQQGLLRTLKRKLNEGSYEH